MEYYLLKYFAKKKYLNDFLDGHLYMNTLHYFWDEDVFEEMIKNQASGSGDGVPVNRLPMLQEDMMEGTLGMYKSEKLMHIFKDYSLCDGILRSVGMGYLNILCFYKLYFDVIDRFDGVKGIDYHPSSEMNTFGDYVAFILNPSELGTRIGNAARKECYRYHAQSVRYYALEKNGEISDVFHRHNMLVRTDTVFDISELLQKGLITKYRDCFQKTEMYQNQNEWRVALYRGERNTDAYTLNVGSLRDIVYWDRRDNFDKALTKAISMGMRPGDHHAYGNISRQELWDDLMKLGDNKAVIMTFIG